MKKWKSLLLSVPIWLVILALVVVGIWPSIEENILPFFQEKPQETVSVGDQFSEFPSADTVIPKNVIQIGDTFECYPEKADGHLLCTVTDVRVVTEESQCPPKEAFFGDDKLFVLQGDEWPKIYSREEWFTEGGAYDQGARLVLVDLEVTNVDAVAWVSDGTLTSTDGYFHDADAFHCYMFVDTADMSKAEKWPDGSEVVSRGMYTLIYFSRQGEYCDEELQTSVGQEPLGIQVPIGQTVRYTLGYAVDGNENGTTPDLSKFWLTVLPGRNIRTEGLRNLEKSIFIDTKLESDVE